MAEPIENIIFDIGGVILHVDFMPAVRAFAVESGLDPDRVIAEIFQSDELHEYDRGRISADEFFRRLRVRLKVRMDEARMRHFWDNIFQENEDVTRLIRDWHGKRKMFLISNTCESHVEQFEKQFDLFKLFHDRVYSCRVGLLKPQVEIYELALKQFGVEASKTLFIDDKPENIEGARKSGLNAHHFTEHGRLLAEIKKLGLA